MVYAWPVCAGSCCICGVSVNCVCCILLEFGVSISLERLDDIFGKGQGKRNKTDWVFQHVEGSF